MTEKIKQHIESLFTNAPETVQAQEMKQEILQNTIDKYNDLLSEGNDSQTAFNMAVSGIGNLEGIIKSLKGESIYTYTSEQLLADKKRNALLLSISVMLYILCILPVILLDGTPFADTLGPALMFIMIAIATGLIIYRAKTKLPQAVKGETVVETIKQINGKTQERDAVKNAVSGAIWAVCIVLYLLISFATGKWATTWIMFILAIALCGVSDAIIDLTRR